MSDKTGILPADTWNKIWTFEPEYGTIYVAVLGFFLVIEGGTHMGKEKYIEKLQD